MKSILEVTQQHADDCLERTAALKGKEKPDFQTAKLKVFKYADTRTIHTFQAAHKGWGKR